MTFTRRRFIQAAGSLGAFAALPAFARTPYSSGEERPRLIAPPGSVDAHMHLYDDRFPAAADATLRPPNALLSDYQQLQQRLGIKRMVIVTPSTYGTDNRCMLDGLARSQGSARGVAVIDGSIADAALSQLHDAGVRGIRFNLSYGGAALSDLERLAARVNELGWNVQIVAPGTQLIDLESRLLKLPSRLVIDHMGHVPQPEGVESAAFKSITRLLDADRVWVKLSGPYIRSKVGAPTYADVGTVASALVKLKPQRLLWGSDWPHPTMALEQKPDDAGILDLLGQWAPNEADRTLILRDNAVALYGFE
jgi:predicted TIM-barrel fold metal-dependent hydrolase